MVTIHVDGVKQEVPAGSRLSDVLEEHPPDCAVAIIRPATQEQARTGNLRFATTAGEIVIELAGQDATVLESPEILGHLSLHWADRYAAAFGPFPSGVRPIRAGQLYERGDVILGCGGYDAARSYLIFAKTRHSADHGAGEGGGIIGRVISGKGVLDRWTTGDRITAIEPVISWADTSRSFTTTDPGLVLEDGMQIVTRIGIVAQGWSPDTITTESRESVEHLLLSLRSRKLVVGRATSAYISDVRTAGPDEIAKEFRHPRREGAVTVRSSGRNAGSIFIYRADVPSSLVHNIAGQVVHGIELAKLAKEGDVLSVSVEPERIDLLGLPFPQAQQITASRQVALKSDNTGQDRIVVSQDPGHTLDVLAERQVAVTTAPVMKVIDIELFDAQAPASVEIFRRITGLREHDAGMMPAFFIFEDVYLFKPPVPTGVRLVPENVPAGEVPAGSLAFTNDSRKGAGTVGVRLSANREFGPTSEPFEGTNIIGRVLDTEKLKKVKEREKVYIREVRR